MIENVVITPDGEFRESEGPEEYRQQIAKWGIDWKYRSAAEVAMDTANQAGLSYESFRNTRPRPDYATEKRWEVESRVDRLEREVKGLNKVVFWLAIMLAMSFLVAALGGIPL